VGSFRGVWGDRTRSAWKQPASDGEPQC
jgi:hypothetical protein